MFVLIMPHKKELGSYMVPVNDSNRLEYKLSKSLHEETVALFEKKYYRKAVINCMGLKYAFDGKLVEYYKLFISDIHEKLNRETD